MIKKIVFFTVFALIVTTVIGYLFWHHEIKYAAPTPKPDNFKDVHLGEQIDLSSVIDPINKSTVLHFFNLDCPCSRFNMKHFEWLSQKYRDKVNFIVVLQTEEENAVDEFKEKYELDLPVILDKDGSISDRCGIYSTPQAVILDSNSVLYFKGNYNKARYCTLKATNFVEMALESLTENKPLPLLVMDKLTVPYGCSLPSDSPIKQPPFLNLFHR